MTFKAEPILPRFGAEISGVDISRPLDEATRGQVLAAMDRWGVCVYRDTGLDNESHIAFSRIFGHLELAPSRPGRPPKYGHRELFDAGNLDADGQIIQDDALLQHKKGDRLWHTDSSFMALRSAYSLLLAHEVPPEGGQTWFADTRSAYEDLPQAMKDRIEGLEAEHSLWWSRKLAGVPLSEEEIDARSKARHPLVHVHAGSGRKTLYVAAHARDIVGMEREAGRALIRELIEWATQPQYVFSVTWRPGDLVVWDNLASMHRGGEYDAHRYRRDMRRTTVREGEPPAAPDDPFGELFGKGMRMLAPATS
ncbi:MAG TPA: TauD/TfdA family dioxygenase [Sphingomonadaceae bacterium]|nr:TauD/TfdA family dioxygenase [Sphingomonadaceae bacterium]